MIEASQLTKTFHDKKRGTVTAVDHISFEARAGEIFGLLGPNGAGKTTTLRLLATVLQPTGGTATIAGHDIRTEAQRVRQMIGFLSGDMGLYHRLTPRELVSFFGRLNGMNSDLLKQRTEQLFATFDMRSFADTKIDALSTGMRQKAAIARTLVHDPAVLILDEPTAGLDVPTAHVVEQFIRNAKNAGKCIVLSTHVMEEAEYLCDRIAVIHQGTIRALGTMPQLRVMTGKERLREIFLDLLGLTSERAGAAL
jgi:sodium transport system ATP-binding protein